MTEGSGRPAFSRTHGFQRPWDLLQMLSWLLFTLFVVEYGVFTVPFLRQPAIYLLGLIYLVCALVSIVFNVLSAWSNASDPGIYCKLDDAKLCSGDRPIGQTSCYLCRAFVDKSSKHCRNCNKCVVGFDHHCKWLNNCIGIRNYRIFFIFMTSTLVTVIFQLGVLTYQFVDSFFSPEHYDLRFREYYGGNVVVFQVIVAVTGALATVTAALLGRLFGFHIMLTLQKKTTYEWILEQREKKRQKEEKKDFLRLNQGTAPSGDLTLHEHRRVMPDNPLNPVQHAAPEQQGKGSVGDLSEEDGTRVLLPSEGRMQKEAQPFLIPRISPISTAALAPPVVTAPGVSPEGLAHWELPHSRSAQRLSHRPSESGGLHFTHREAGVLHVAPRPFAPHPPGGSTSIEMEPSGDDRLRSPPSIRTVTTIATPVRSGDVESPPHVHFITSQRGMDTVSVGMESNGIPFSPVEGFIPRLKTTASQEADCIDCEDGINVEPTSNLALFPHLHAPGKGRLEDA
eukprot:GGOE01028590.1.p1 GENE.GGOE01028590.1~~GGOE01028590.1.p1  ORF type:complete len:510 (-),score=79.02 GGOE01028590.1:618-2147(-)